MALVNNPQVVFLDEPTAGLDPQVRREIYDIIEELRKDKKTVLLTTHYIEEAERLCDRVAIVDYGTHDQNRHAARTEALLRRNHAHRSAPGPAAHRRSRCGTLEGVADCREFDGTYVMHSTLPPRTIVALVKQLEAENNELQSLEMFSPSLEDVFIELTGRRLRD